MLDRLVKHVIAAELQVAPDARFLAGQLCHAGVEHLVELGDPALVLLGQRLIVDVRVANENVVQVLPVFRRMPD